VVAFVGAFVGGSLGGIFVVGVVGASVGASVGPEAAALMQMLEYLLLVLPFLSVLYHTAFPRLKQPGWMRFHAFVFFHLLERDFCACLHEASSSMGVYPLWQTFVPRADSK